jgi:hypothetical protein
LTPRQRETALSLAFAVWGLAAGIAFVSIWNRPAPPEQLPGLAKMLGFDAHAPFRWIAGLMLLPMLAAFALRPLAARLAVARSWSVNATIAACLIALAGAPIHRQLFWAVVPPAIAVAVAVVFRHRDLGFTRRDVLLLPVVLTACLGIIDALPAIGTGNAIHVALLLVFVIRVAVGLLPGPIAPAYAFLAAPLGLLLQTGFFARDQRYFGWHALILVAVTPFVLRPLLRNERRAARVLALLVYPLALYCYSNALSLTTAEGKPRIHFFEDGHALMPASEYLRGERPWLDVLPAHGLLEDGGFDILAMRLGGVDAGSTQKARFVAGTFVTVALYFVAYAATGSAEGAFLAVMLSIFTGSMRDSVRFIPPFAALAFLAGAVRQRRPRWFAYAGFLCVVAGVTSLDFAAYTFVTFVIAVIRARSKAVLRFAALGLAAGVVPLLLSLGITGLLDDFVRGTFAETLAVGPAYTLELFTPTPALDKLRTFPDALAALLDRATFPYLAWCLIAVFTGVTVTRRVSRRLEPMVLLGVWTVLTAISYAERHHLYFGMIAGVMIVYAILRLLRSGRTTAAAIAIGACIVLASPSTHLGVIGWMREARGPVEAQWSEIAGLPRARGALFHESDVRFVNSARKYVSLTLQPDETFFDFTNSSLLYFLLRRDFPIREYEVAFYETEEGQREVIRRIEENPKIRAALVPATPHGRFSVDGVPNAERAPLVWQYLQQNFHPDFAEGEVVFWRRRTPRHNPARPWPVSPRSFSSAIPSPFRSSARMEPSTSRR